jgi:N-methylhydantoinase A
VHIAERGHQADRFALLVTGGGGPLHGCEVARRLGIRRVICPPGAGVASALGLLMAPARIDRAATVAKPLSALDWGALEAQFRALEADARRTIEATLAEVVEPDIARMADMRFVGQGYEIVTDLPPGPYSPQHAAALREAFESAYRRVFARKPPEGEVEIINIRVSLSASGAGGGTLDPGMAASSGESGDDTGAPRPRERRAVRFAAEPAPVETPVYRRRDLPAGARIAGPAVVEEAVATLLIPPGARGTVEPNGNIVVELRPAP